MKGNKIARMWVVRGDGGSLYEDFRARGFSAVGWNQLAAHAKPGVGGKQLIALYPSAEPQAKQGMFISGESQFWRFFNDIHDGDWVVTYSPASRLYLIGKVTGPADHHAEREQHASSRALKNSALSPPTRQA
ncbi:hypothetical protein [Pseudomonas sp. S3E12]|uniref:hypothetical protein n=1 Tax=Pseudomonas sp. S3E12 TaxID=1873126 RepID=UPI00157D2F0F|nr:hypothetical protein [Pseudomonas sp. S3E12]